MAQYYKVARKSLTSPLQVLCAMVTVTATSFLGSNAHAMCLDANITIMRATIVQCIDPKPFVIWSAKEHYRQVLSRDVPRMTHENYIEAAEGYAASRRIVVLDMRQTVVYRLYDLDTSPYNKIDDPQESVSDFPSFGIFYAAGPESISCDGLLAMPEENWVLDESCYDSPDPLRFPALYSFKQVHMLNDFDRSNLRQRRIEFAEKQNSRISTTVQAWPRASVHVPPNKSLHWPPGGMCHGSCSCHDWAGNNRASYLAPVS